MPVSIRRIEITNFRSIQKIVIDSARLQVIVGNNDAGKSNILRALNLFLTHKQIQGSLLILQLITIFMQLEKILKKPGK
ncbi:hypothetical protein LL13F55_39770 [Escherichia coli]